MCKKYIWLKIHCVKADIFQDIIKYVLTNEKCLIWQTDQSEIFAVLCALYELPCQTNTRISLGSHYGLH